MSTASPLGCKKIEKSTTLKSCDCITDGAHKSKNFHIFETTVNFSLLISYTCCQEAALWLFFDYFQSTLYYVASRYCSHGYSMAAPSVISGGTSWILCRLFSSLQLLTGCSISAVWEHFYILTDQPTWRRIYAAETNCNFLIVLKCFEHKFIPFMNKEISNTNTSSWLVNQKKPVFLKLSLIFDIFSFIFLILTNLMLIKI